MENILKISIKRLSDSAGVKSISTDCYDLIRELIEDKLKEVVEISCAIMTEGNSKTLHESDVHHALELLGDYTTQSSSE